MNADRRCAATASSGFSSHAALVPAVKVLRKVLIVCGKQRNTS